MDISLLALLILTLLLGAVTVIDIRMGRIPDVLNAAITCSGLILGRGLEDGGWPWLLGAMAFVLIVLWGIRYTYAMARGRQGLGFGDVKLIVASVPWIGALAVPTMMLWSTFTALAYLLISRLAGQEIRADTKLPFGPFLAFGFLMAWIFGPIDVGRALANADSVRGYSAETRADLTVLTATCERRLKIAASIVGHQPASARNIIVTTVHPRSPTIGISRQHKTMVAEMPLSKTTSTPNSFICDWSKSNPPGPGDRTCRLLHPSRGWP